MEKKIRGKKGGGAHINNCGFTKFSPRIGIDYPVQAVSRGPSMSLHGEIIPL